MVDIVEMDMHFARYKDYLEDKHMTDKIVGR